MRRRSDLFQSEPWLAHYTRASTAFEHILPRGRLRMSPYSMMRDPYENQELGFYSGSGTGDREAANEAVRRLRAPVRLASFTEYFSAPLAQRPNHAPWAHPRMWEQYAEGHAGVCLIFDREALVGSLDPTCLECGPVVYDVEGWTGTEGASIDLDGITEVNAGEKVEQHVRDHFHDFFFVKHTDYEAEREFRVVEHRDTIAVGRADVEPHVFLSVASALRYVIVGEKFPNWQIPAAKSAANDWDVELRKMSWDLGYPFPEPMAE